MTTHAYPPIYLEMARQLLQGCAAGLIRRGLTTTEAFQAVRKHTALSMKSAVALIEDDAERYPHHPNDPARLKATATLMGQAAGGLLASKSNPTVEQALAQVGQERIRFVEIIEQGRAEEVTQSKAEKERRIALGQQPRQLEGTITYTQNVQAAYSQLYSGVIVGVLATGASLPKTLELVNRQSLRDDLVARARYVVRVIHEDYPEDVKNIRLAMTTGLAASHIAEKIMPHNPAREGAVKGEWVRLDVSDYDRFVKRGSRMFEEFQADQPYRGGAELSGLDMPQALDAMTKTSPARSQFDQRRTHSP